MKGPERHPAWAGRLHLHARLGYAEISRPRWRIAYHSDVEARVGEIPES